jgi:hypothetical protein
MSSSSSLCQIPVIDKGESERKPIRLACAIRAAQTRVWQVNAQIHGSCASTQIRWVHHVSVITCRRPSAVVNLNCVTNRVAQGPRYKLSYDAGTPAPNRATPCVDYSNLLTLALVAIYTWRTGQGEVDPTGARPLVPSSTHPRE